MWHLRIDIKASINFCTNDAYNWSLQIQQCPVENDNIHVHSIFTFLLSCFIPLIFAMREHPFNLKGGCGFFRFAAQRKYVLETTCHDICFFYKNNFLSKVLTELFLPMPETNQIFWHKPVFPFKFIGCSLSYTEIRKYIYIPGKNVTLSTLK